MKAKPVLDLLERELRPPTKLQFFKKKIEKKKMNKKNLDWTVSSKDSVNFSLVCFVTQVEDSYSACFWRR